MHRMRLVAELSATCSNAEEHRLYNAARATTRALGQAPRRND